MNIQYFEMNNTSVRSGAAVKTLLPMGGLSLLDAPSQPFHNPAADAVLFDTLDACSW